MKLHKYHSCENYFLITDFIDNIDYDILSKRLCDKYSVDGMIFVKMDPVQMYFYNKDGSKAKMCGNGIRTLMHYLYNRYGIYTHLDIKTDSGIYSCEILNKEPFVSSVSLGGGEFKEDIINKTFQINDKDFIVTLFELGVKHLVVLTNDMLEDEKYILDLFNYPLFNKEVNINLVKPLNNNIFEILTYERGVGFTKSCGTGAASSAYVLNSIYGFDSNLIALCPGGVLKIDISDEIVLIGESVFIESYEEII